jgi:hypothetical protein
MADKPTSIDAWTPAFPSQRPPFAEGNTLSTRHGARSRRVAPLARKILREYLNDPSLPTYLRDPSYLGALTGLARAEAVVSLLEAHVAKQSIEDAVSTPAGALEQLRRWLVVAQSHRRALGLDPLSRGQLGRDVAVAQAAATDALTQHTNEGAAVLARRSDITDAEVTE